MPKNLNQEIIDDGFSSDEEFRQEQIVIDASKKQQAEKPHREEVKFKIPPPQQIKVKSYSLHPDIATGWSRKSQGPTPVPLLFNDRRIDMLIRKISDNKNITNDKMKLCYLGPRFQNTFQAWYDQKFNFPYSNFKAPTNMKFTDRVFCGQHWDAVNGLIFNSFFQSGNLDCVIRVDEYEYDLYLRVDSNTRGHLNWYNFKVKNMEKLQKYKFNICNIQKLRTLYTRGMKPYIFSDKKFLQSKKGWEQGGDSMKFQQKFSKSMKLLNLECCTLCKLSFDFYTEFSDDQIQMAYCVPYTYTDLLSFLNSLEKKHINKDLMTMSNLCSSLGGLNIPIVTVHQNKMAQNIQLLSQQQQNDVIPKKCIVVSGRVHPGQSNGSYMIHGFLQYLCGNSKQAKQLRQDFIIKIVPMLNPDGVCLGNYRTGISGKDFNREYRNPDRTLFPQIYAFKKLVTQNKAIYKENLLMFLDFHGHSMKKNVFMYGPEFPIIQKNYYESRIFPKLLGNLTNMFRYYSCSFKISNQKATTARAIFLRNLCIPFSYTIEASNGSYYDTQALKDHPFTDKSWQKMGKLIGTALAEYCEMVNSTLRNRIEKKKQRDRKFNKTLKPRNISKNKDFQISQGLEQYSHNIFYNEDNKKKKMLGQIKLAESKRNQLQNDEDQIREGSSDGQDEKQDLQPMMLNYLYQAIKNKTPTCGNLKRYYRSSNQLDDDRLYTTTQQNQQFPFQREEQIEMKTKKKWINPRSCLLKSKQNKSFNQNQQKVQHNLGARIINFNFFCVTKSPFGHRKQFPLKGNRSLQLCGPDIINSFQSQRNERRRRQIVSIPKQTKVLDLSNRNNTNKSVSSQRNSNNRIITKNRSENQDRSEIQKRILWKNNHMIQSRLMSAQRGR